MQRRRRDTAFIFVCGVEYFSWNRTGTYALVASTSKLFEVEPWRGLVAVVDAGRRGHPSPLVDITVFTCTSWTVTIQVVKATYVDARLTHYFPFNRFDPFRFLCQTWDFPRVAFCFVFYSTFHAIFREISDICVGWQWTTNVTISSLGSMTYRSLCTLHCRVAVFSSVRFRFESILAYLSQSQSNVAPRCLTAHSRHYG